MPDLTSGASCRPTMSGAAAKALYRDSPAPGRSEVYRTDILRYLLRAPEEESCVIAL